MPKVLVLTGITGTRVGIQAILSGRINSIGSDQSCDLVISDHSIALRHAEIRQALERWFIVPSAPKAKIFLNGVLLTGQNRVTEGDLVTLGNITFKITFSEIVEPTMGGNGGSAPTQGMLRLGEFLVKRGIVRSNQVDQALQRQADLRSRGRYVQIGELLYELGYISQYQLEQALQEQHRAFFGGFQK